MDFMFAGKITFIHNEAHSFRFLPFVITAVYLLSYENNITTFEFLR